MAATTFPMIVTANGETRSVKNLGWLLHHASEVESLHLSPRVDGGGWLDATLTDGTRYFAEFASWSVLIIWVRRRSLCHATVSLHCNRSVVGHLDCTT